MTLDQLVAAGHGDKQYQELFAEMSVFCSSILFCYLCTCALSLHVCVHRCRSSVNFGGKDIFALKYIMKN